MAEHEAPRKRALIIDDDAEFAYALKLQLSKDGIDVQTCHYGEQGLSDAVSFRPDLVILDVLMPGIHGIAVLEELRRTPELAGVQIMVITGLNTPEIEEEVMRLKAHFVPKTSSALGITSKAKKMLGVL